MSDQNVNGNDETSASKRGLNESVLTGDPKRTESDPVSMNRRDILGGIAGGALGLGALSGSAAAREDSPGFEIKTLEPPQSARILGDLKRTDEYRRIREYVTDELDGKFRLSAAHATVVEVHDKDSSRGRIFAYSEIESTAGDEAHVTMGLDTETKEIVTAGAEVVTTEKISPNDYPIQFEDLEGETATVPAKIDMADATGNQVTTATVTNEDFDRINTKLGGSSDGLSIQSSYTCDLCKTAVTALCFAGCGAPVWFLCGLIGVGTGGIGGFACGAFVVVACTLISVYGCVTRGFDRRICSDRRIGLC